MQCATTINKRRRLPLLMVSQIYLCVFKPRKSESKIRQKKIIFFVHKAQIFNKNATKNILFFLRPKSFLFFRSTKNYTIFTHYGYFSFILLLWFIFPSLQTRQQTRAFRRRREIKKEEKTTFHRFFFTFNFILAKQDQCNSHSWQSSGMGTSLSMPFFL